jgi:molybdopterin synthase sulfur carrier subunit
VYRGHNDDMSVCIKFFASMRETLGQSELRIDIETPVTVADVWQRATGDRPMPDNTVCAVNHSQATLDTAVNDGDEVAFFPPVTGG